MEKNYQKKHYFLAFAVLIGVFAPILYFFLPQTVSDILHHKDGVWFVSVPEEAFTAFLVGFACLFISSFILYLLDIRKLSVVISILFLSMAFGSFFLASQNYMTLSNENIAFSPFFSMEKDSYPWDQVEQIIHFRNEQGDISEYEFVFDDDNRVKIKDTAYFKEKSFKFQKKLAEENLQVSFSLLEEQ